MYLGIMINFKMIIIKYLIIVTSLFLAISFSSCKNSDHVSAPNDGRASNQMNDAASAFISFFNADFQNSITLEKYSVQGVSPNDKAKLIGAFYDEQKKTLPNQGRINVNGTDYYQHPQMGIIYSGPSTVPCFGQTNVIKYYNSADSLIFTQTLNVPEEVVISSNWSEFNAQSTITFNADPTNSKGLICVFKFSSNNPYNKDFSTHPDVTNMAHIENDNGSFAITTSLIEKIPDGAIVEILIVRGNYAPINLSNNSFGIIAFSNCTTDARLAL